MPTESLFSVIVYTSRHFRVVNFKFCKEFSLRLHKCKKPHTLSCVATVCCKHNGQISCKKGLSGQSLQCIRLIRGLHILEQDDETHLELQFSRLL
uniref:Uncharacterized protein n=1 Tax=Anguilla anguilla TaxID=7936 RepID=A0A0E9SKU0_ANGAN